MSIFKRLQPSEITITPFKAHKKYTPTVDNIDSSSGVSVTEGVNYDDHFYTAEEKNTNGIYKRTIYHLVNKLHYKFEYDPAQTITNNTREVLEKNYVTNAEDVPFPTHQSASITHICIPQQKFGEGIKPGTVKITTSSGSLNGEVYLDDKLGNLYSSTKSASWDSSTSSSYWPPSSSLKGYWKFDNASEPYIDYSGYGNHAHHTGSTWTTYYDTASIFDGFAIKTSNSIGGEGGMSGVRLAEHKDLINQNKQTWTFWFKPDGHNNASSEARIISRDLSEYFGLRENGAYDSNGKCDIIVSRGNGATSAHTNALISGSWHFTAFSIDYTEQKLSFYLWNGEQWFENVNSTTGGVNAWNGNDNPQERNRMVILGANSERETDIHMSQTATNFFSGSYDEVRYYDTNLSEEQIYALKDFPRGAKESFVGDVWYNQGEIVVKTMGEHKNLALGTGSDGFELEWDATVKINEHEYRCTAEVDEFNKTINRSIIAESLNNDELIGVASHSLFSPYITTVGLYDQNYALLAIGKLARPIKTSTETPITFVVRLDF